MILSSNAPRIGIFCLAIITLSIAACTFTNVKVRMAPKHHVWDTLIQEGYERPGYGMYTYVLFQRRVDALADINPKIAKRYKNLLDIITGSMPTAEEARTAVRYANLFCIPSNEIYVGGEFVLKNYNSKLAKTYISKLCNMIQDDNKLVERFNDRPGPFLISTLHTSLNLIQPQLRQLLWPTESTSGVQLLMVWKASILYA
ncbi:MAG: hypothetical protein JRE64_04730 [Deltaproteobacteria bacterium]|nr:hypothetical protein [Deltaproteobacteria bacterium]